MSRADEHRGCAPTKRAKATPRAWATSALSWSGTVPRTSYALTIVAIDGHAGGSGWDGLTCGSQPIRLVRPVVRPRRRTPSASARGLGSGRSGSDGRVASVEIEIGRRPSARRVGDAAVRRPRRQRRRSRAASAPIAGVETSERCRRRSSSSRSSTGRRRGRARPVDGYTTSPSSTPEEQQRDAEHGEQRRRARRARERP